MLVSSDDEIFTAPAVPSCSRTASTKESECLSEQEILSPTMKAASWKEKLCEIEHIISKMPLAMCVKFVLPEFCVRWKEVAKAVRSNRLPMIPRSVARVLHRQYGKSLPDSEIAEILARLRLKLTAIQERKWNLINLQEPIEEQESIGYMMEVLPDRVAQALVGKRRRGIRITPKVQTFILDDLLYMSVQITSATKEGPVLYLATPPGHPVALVNSVTSSLLKGSVQGLGFKKFEDAQLSGKDIPSLLRIHNTNINENVKHLSGVPKYDPQPVITSNSKSVTIDYTRKDYNMQYVDAVLGPNPPLLTELKLTTSKPFFDPSRLKKKMNLSVKLKSDNVAQTLKSWVNKGALHPTSDLFKIFEVVKSNTVTCQVSDSDSDD